MILQFSTNAWDDYLYWQKTDKAILKRVNLLIVDIVRGPFDGIGKPEPLKFDYAGTWSRRITQEHRLVYGVSDDVVTSVSCRHHYDR